MRLIILFFLLFPLLPISAQAVDTPGADTLGIDTTNFHFRPGFAGGQIELTSILAVTEYGALIDMDIFQKISDIHYSFGLRFSVEAYGYFEPGGPTEGGPFRDYCAYFYHSGRGTKIHVTLLGGASYHTTKDDYYPDVLKPRIGFEIRYNIVNTVMAIILKGATSFDSKTGFAGIGIALGYYN